MIAPGASAPAERTRVDAVVIGGGVVGCAILRELAVRGIEAILLEAENDIGERASKANSAILHTGFDAKPGTTEARLLRRTLDQWPELLDELAVPYLQCGALMLARSDEEAVRLRGVAELSATNGVDATVVARDELRATAPWITPDAVAALSIESEGIVDPFWLTRAFAEAAIARGAQVWTRARVVGIDVDDDGVDIRLGDGREIRAAQAFDAAGLWADDVAALAGDTSFRLTPRKGQFLISEWTAGVDRIVLPIPGPLGKGMLVTPIVFGGLLLGPTAEDGDDKDDRGTDEDGRRRILDACRGLVPAVDEMAPIRRFAGVRAVSSTGDYIIRPSTAGDRLTLVAGIRSTGISASPAIAEAAVDLASTARGWDRSVPAVPVAMPAGGFGLEGDAGAIVCVCRSVGEAEVSAALAGPAPATTVDALKRRCGAGFGDCQGGMCLAPIIERLAGPRGDPARIEKGPVGSWILAGVEPVERARDDALTSVTRAVDVVVVGGGMAGIGAALAARDAGSRVAVVDRAGQLGGALGRAGDGIWTDSEHDARDQARVALPGGDITLIGATVVGLDRSSFGGTWRLDLQGASGSSTLEARAVILATGGYVTPRDHLGIDGPRPAGIMTADFAWDALARGWLPGRRVVVVGEGRMAHALVERCQTVGIAVMRHVTATVDTAAIERVREVRGDPRLEAIRIDGRWIEADGLILAHELRAASFLLRGLGLGDDRPGIPMPADAEGRLPMDGLWAAGTCVAPDIDHGGSLADGRRVGAAVAAALAAVPATTNR